MTFELFICLTGAPCIVCGTAIHCYVLVSQALLYTIRCFVISPFPMTFSTSFSRLPPGWCNRFKPLLWTMAVLTANLSSQIAFNYSLSTMCCHQQMINKGYAGDLQLVLLALSCLKWTAHSSKAFAMALLQLQHYVALHSMYTLGSLYMLPWALFLRNAPTWNIWGVY